MKKEGTIVIVDDNRSILTALNLLLGSLFDRVIAISNPNQLPFVMRENRVDVVLLDMNFSGSINSGNEGLFWLSEIKKQQKNSEVVMFTAYADIELAVKAIKNGACDFVVKPWDNNKLIATLTGAYNLSKSRKEVRQLQEIKREFLKPQQMYWGESKVMKELREIVGKVAPTDANILIIGENGTGKELLAQEIHHLSLRQQESMISVDMCSLTETLFESELFGHVKGAFTDAKSDRAGKFEMATNGTLFLDEIGNLPLHLQAKLLTALQTRKIVRVGSNSPIDINIRLISATNQCIESMVEKGLFRNDLMYRMNTITIRLAPLRERVEDILPLSDRFIGKYSVKYNKSHKELTDGAAEKLMSYSWPGNIRELEHSIEKAVIICDTPKLSEDHFFLSNDKSLPKENLTIEEMEIDMIKSAITKYESNLSLVASVLGITRQTLYNKIKKYNL